MNSEQIAKICYEANKAYCEALGDNSQPTWLELPESIKESAIDGVDFLIANPDTTPEQMHENWRKCKEEAGWVYKKEKSAMRKTHPSLVDFDELPESEQLKDILFSNIVKVFTDD